MINPSALLDKKFIPGNIFDRSGILGDLAYISVCLFVFLIPWGQSISTSFPANVGLIAFVLTTAAFVVEGTHRKYTIYHFFVILCT